MSKFGRREMGSNPIFYFCLEVPLNHVDDDILNKHFIFGIRQPLIGHVEFPERCASELPRAGAGVVDAAIPLNELIHPSDLFGFPLSARQSQESLQACGVRADSPEYAKWAAVANANLDAAILCNHTKKDTGNWEARKLRYEERIAKAQERLERYRGQLADRKEALQVLQVEAASKRAIAQARLDKVNPEKESQLEKARAYLQRTVERYDKRLARARSLIETAEARVQRTRGAIGKIQAQMELANHKRTWNLGTSLKSYIDPRVYVRWGEQVEYDVLERYYPKTLRRKFAWARGDDGESEQAAD